MTLIEPSWDEARVAAANLANLVRLQATEIVPINQSSNRVLAIAAKSLVELPTYITSAMDGYAVAGNGPWNLIGEIKAGSPFQGRLEPGQALGIATGAVIPEGAFGILRWENATVNGNQISGETSEEKVSLSERFGLWLSFYAFDQDEYLTVAAYWLAQYGIADMNDEVRRAALTFSLTRGARSGRVAYQFARDYAGRKGLMA